MPAGRVFPCRTLTRLGMLCMLALERRDGQNPLAWTLGLS